MNFDTTNLRAIPLVKIELASQTLRLSTEDVYAKDIDGSYYFWKGAVQSIDPFVSGFRDIAGGNSIISYTSLRLFGGKRFASDISLDDIFKDEDLIDSRVTIFLVGESTATEVVSGSEVGGFAIGPELTMGPELFMGPSWETMSVTSFVISGGDVIFKGALSYPDPIYDWNETTIGLRVTDRKYLEILSMSDQFGVYGKVPVVYGDFSDSFCLNEEEADDAAILYVADGQTPFTTDETMEDADLLDATTPKLVSGAGITRGTAIAALFGGSSSDVITHPVEMIYDILTVRLGTLVAEMDTASFTTVYNSLVGYEARRVFNGDESIGTALEEILFEFNLGLVIKNGLMHLTQLDLSATSSYSLDEIDVLPGTYSLSIDPNKASFNEYGYEYGAVSKGQRGSESLFGQDGYEASRVGGASILSKTSQWNFISAFIHSSITSVMTIVRHKVNLVNVATSHRLFSLIPNNIVTMTFHIWESASMLVRSVSRTFDSFNVQLELLKLPTVTFKTFGADPGSARADYAAAVAATTATYYSSHEIITGFNDTIEFITNATFTATLLPGFYSPSEMAEELERALNATATTVPMSVSYSASTYKFTIVTDNASNFSLNWLTTPEIARSILGFDASANDTGAATYTSDYICVFESQGAISAWR